MINIQTAPKYYDGKKQHKGETTPAGLAGNSNSSQVTAKVGAAVDSRNHITVNRGSSQTSVAGCRQRQRQLLK